MAEKIKPQFEIIYDHVDYFHFAFKNEWLKKIFKIKLQLPILITYIL